MFPAMRDFLLKSKKIRHSWTDTMDVVTLPSNTRNLDVTLKEIVLFRRNTKSNTMLIFDIKES